MWCIGQSERNRCPAEFQERLTSVGGVNRYDQPNFVMFWGQTETFRAGGAWEIAGLPSFRGYRDLLLGHGDPCWLLCQWNPPEVYGTPESWYVQNYDEDTALQILGEYPYSGRYEVLFPLQHKAIVNGSLVLDRMPLSNLLINAVVPLIIEAKSISLEKRKAAFDALKEREEREKTSQIEAAWLDKKMAFGGNPVSFTRQGCKTSIIDRKVKELERHWDKAVSQVRSMGKGISQA